MTASPSLALRVLEPELAVCRLLADMPAPPFPDAAELYSVTRTGDELSVVCPVGSAPNDAIVEAGWRAFAVAGPMAFDLVGVVAALTTPLADAGIPVFVISTYDTDYLLVREVTLTGAVAALRTAGHTVR